MGGIMRKVCGVGINDGGYAVYKKDKSGVRKVCPYYMTWCNMLNRCYSEKYSERNPSYKGCTVSNEWLYFSNFKKWMEDQDWEGKSLDKDILVKGNKLYSAETCIFIPESINGLFAKCSNDGNSLPRGVYFNKPSGKYMASSSDGNYRKYLGLFDTKEEAHHAWLEHKKERSRLLCEQYNLDKGVTEAIIKWFDN